MLSQPVSRCALIDEGQILKPLLPLDKRLCVVVLKTLEDDRAVVVLDRDELRDPFHYIPSCERVDRRLRIVFKVLASPSLAPCFVA